ncbi:MAG: hypothetical protein IKU12_06150 [Oscillospiraceae bacterium]|nr:hypothetical protein [Oscillospiraceae bacterium]
MQEVRISDVTMSQVNTSLSLSFKEKLELSKLLDKLGVSVIELEGIERLKIDSLRIKSAAAAVKNSILAVPVQLDLENVTAVWNALKEARRPRLQVVAPVSPVQMEYLFHKKPAAMLDAIRDTVSACKALTQDVEFVADDATRSDRAFLISAVNTAIEAGATTVTVCDTAGAMLSDEFGAFIDSLYEEIPALKDVTLGVSCSNELAMADACAIAAVRRGAREVKAASYGANVASLANVSRVIARTGDAFGVNCRIRTTEMKRVISQIRWLCETERSKNSPFDNVLQADSGAAILTCHDDMSAVLKAVESLGYDLSEEDGAKVYESFRNIIGKKNEVSARELDAIVASAAMQVPPTYTLESFVITSGNTISATAHIKLKKGESILEGVVIGDGPIDAAFLAIEQIVGCHYELDDFQIQSVTEGRAAMGETVVKLRSSGKVYSGRGISTDIVGASVRAYLSAVNKIAYEEAEA